MTLGSCRRRAWRSRRAKTAIQTSGDGATIPWSDHLDARSPVVHRKPLTRSHSNDQMKARLASLRQPSIGSRWTGACTWALVTLLVGCTSSSQTRGMDTEIGDSLRSLVASRSNASISTTPTPQNKNETNKVASIEPSIILRAMNSSRQMLLASVNGTNLTSHSLSGIQQEAHQTGASSNRVVVEGYPVDSGLSGGPKDSDTRMVVYKTSSKKEIEDPMQTAASKKKKKAMKKSKKMEKKHKEWKKGKKHKKKKYESKKKKGGSSKKKKGKKEKKKWGMEKKGHKKKGNFKKKKWGHKKKMKKGHKKGKKGHKMLKDKGHKKKGFKKIYHKEEWGKKKKWHDIKREKKWNTKQKKWKKKWHQEKGKKYKGKHMKKYHKKNKHGKKYKKEKKSKWKKHKGEKFKKGHKKKKEEYSKKKEGGKKKKMKKSKKEMKKKKKG